MQKYIPALSFVLVFTGLLSLQVGLDLFSSSAEQSKEQEKLHAHYESVFKSSVFKDTEGQVYRPESIDAPVVVVNFWASWCQPCLEEFPSLVEFRKNFPASDVKVIGINADEEDQMKKIKKTVEKFNLNFPIVADHEGKILSDFMVSTLPVSIIFHKGKVIEVSRERKDFASIEFKEKIKSLL